MPLQKPKPRASPIPVVIPAEMDELILCIYPRAVDRVTIKNGIQDFVKQLQAQGRHADIPVFLQTEMDAMQIELRALDKGKRRKLFSIIGKMVLTALAILSHWHW